MFASCGGDWITLIKDHFQFFPFSLSLTHNGAYSRHAPSISKCCASKQPLPPLYVSEEIKDWFASKPKWKYLALRVVFHAMRNTFLAVHPGNGMRCLSRKQGWCQAIPQWMQIFPRIGNKLSRDSRCQMLPPADTVNVTTHTQATLVWSASAQKNPLRLSRETAISLRESHHLRGFSLVKSRFILSPKFQRDIEAGIACVQNNVCLLTSRGVSVVWRKYFPYFIKRLACNDFLTIFSSKNIHVK